MHTPDAAGNHLLSAADFTNRGAAVNRCAGAAARQTLNPSGGSSAANSIQITSALSSAAVSHVTHSQTQRHVWQGPASRRHHCPLPRSMAAPTHVCHQKPRDAPRVRPMAISLPRLTRLAWPVLVNICKGEQANRSRCIFEPGARGGQGPGDGGAGRPVPIALRAAAVAPWRGFGPPRPPAGACRPRRRAARPRDLPRLAPVLACVARITALPDMAAFGSGPGAQSVRVEEGARWSGAAGLGQGRASSEMAGTGVAGLLGAAKGALPAACCAHAA